MPHRVLVLGNTGMLGHMVEHVLAADKQFTVRGVRRAEFDVEQCGGGACGKTSGVEEESKATGKHPMLRSARPSVNALLTNANYVINCIGITARHIDDVDPTSVSRAIRVNAEFPHALAAAALERGVRVIHMSTDGVFSGRSSEPYGENAAPDATDIYGRTKLLGESQAPNVLNIRTSIIGPSPYKGEGFWEWVASQPDGATVNGYTNHLWHGVTTLQFSELCQRIITEDRFDALRAHGHILHFAPNASVTKAELVAAIAAAVGKRITVRPVTHAQPTHRVLTMRPDVTAIFGAGQPIAETLRACVAARA